MLHAAQVMNPEPFWLDTAPRFGAGAAGGVDGRADVVVVGGGLTGLAAARALARRGASVVVLEAATVVGDASGRNGGQCNGGLTRDYGALIQKFGLDQVRVFHQAYGAAVDTVEQVAHVEGIDCDFVRNGRLKLAAKPQHYAKLARLCELLARSFDPDVRMIAASDIRSEVNSAEFHGGLLHGSGAHLHVGKFGIGLAEAAVRHGARIYESARVTGIERTDRGARRVTCLRGAIDAGQVLLATGCSGTGPFGWYRRRLAPVGSFIVVTEPLDAGLLNQLLPQRRSYVTSRHIGNYFRATADNRLVFGGRARFAMSDARSDLKSGAILRTALTRFFPELARARLEYCWGGLVDITADRLPRAGEHDGLYYSMGYSGHGVQMSVYMGEVMAAVMNGNPAANPWAVLDWPAMPGHVGKAWFLPLVGAYYRTLDLIS